MKPTKQRTILLITLLWVLVSTNSVYAISPARSAYRAAKVEETNSTQVAQDAVAATSGIAFRVAYNDGRYKVMMKPAASATAPALTLTAQVTLKVAHSATTPFEVTDLVNNVEGTAWSLSSRINAPAEDATADYLSFTVEFPTGNYQAIEWVAEQEIEVFSFANANDCLGAVNVMSNEDPFAQVPNSASTNPGNQIDVLGMGDGNQFNNVVGEAATCLVPDARTLNHKVFLPITVR